MILVSGNTIPPKGKNIQKNGGIAYLCTLNYRTNPKHIANMEQPQIYLFAIIRNKALESLRNRKTALLAKNELSLASERDYNLRIKSAEACDPQILYSKEVQAIIKSGLKDLGTQTREVFILSRYEGMSNKDIAKKLGLSPKTVEYHMTKSLKYFKEKLKDYLPLLLFFCVNLTN